MGWVSLVQTFALLGCPRKRSSRGDSWLGWNSRGGWARGALFGGCYLHVACLPTDKSPAQERAPSASLHLSLLPEKQQNNYQPIKYSFLVPLESKQFCKIKDRDILPHFTIYIWPGRAAVPTKAADCSFSILSRHCDVALMKMHLLWNQSYETHRRQAGYSWPGPAAFAKILEKIQDTAAAKLKSGVRSKLITLGRDIHSWLSPCLPRSDQQSGKPRGTC